MPKQKAGPRKGSRVYSWLGFFKEHQEDGLSLEEFGARGEKISNTVDDLNTLFRYGYIEERSERYYINEAGLEAYRSAT